MHSTYWRSIWPNANLTQRSDQMSTWLKVVLHLATRCLCLRGMSDQMSPWPIKLTKMSSWPKVISHLATRCLCPGEYVWPYVNLTHTIDQNVILTQSSITLGHKMSLPGGVYLTKCQADPKIWPNANLIQSSVTLGHKMSLPREVHLTTGPPDLKSDQMSTWLEVSSVGVHLTKCRKVIWILNTLWGFSLVSQRSFLTKDQKEQV